MDNDHIDEKIMEIMENDHIDLALRIKSLLIIFHDGKIMENDRLALKLKSLLIIHAIRELFQGIFLNDINNILFLKFVDLCNIVRFDWIDETNPDFNSQAVTQKLHTFFKLRHKYEKNIQGILLNFIKAYDVGYEPRGPTTFTARKSIECTIEMSRDLYFRALNYFKLVQNPTMDDLQDHLTTLLLYLMVLKDHPLLNIAMLCLSTYEDLYDYQIDAWKYTTFNSRT
jgi:hypothetical protein